MPDIRTPGPAGFNLADTTAPVTVLVDDDYITPDNTYWQTFPYSTTVAAGSDGAPVASAVIYVASTLTAPGAGSIWISALGALIAYTSTTGGATPSLNGCTVTNAATGNLATGQVVTPGYPNLTLLRLACLITLLASGFAQLISSLANVAFLNIVQTFTAAQTFAAGLIASKVTASGGTGLPAIAAVGTASSTALVDILQDGAAPGLTVEQSGTGPAVTVSSSTCTDTGGLIKITNGSNEGAVNIVSTGGGEGLTVNNAGGTASPINAIANGTAGTPCITANAGPIELNGTNGATPVGTPGANMLYGNSFIKAGANVDASGASAVARGTPLNCTVSYATDPATSLAAVKITFLTPMADGYYIPSVTMLSGGGVSGGACYQCPAASMTAASFYVLFLDKTGTPLVPGVAPLVFAVTVNGTQ